MRVPGERGRGRAFTACCFEVLVAYLALLTVFWIVGIEAIYGHVTPFYARFEPVFGSLFVPGILLGGWAGSVWVMSQRYLDRSRQRYYGGLLLLGLLFVWLLVLLYRESQVTGVAYGALSRAYALQLRNPLIATGLVVALLAAVRRGYAVSGRAPGLSGGRLVLALAGLMAFSVCFSVAIAAMRGGDPGLAGAYGRSAYEVAGDIEQIAGVRAFLGRYTALQPGLSIHGRVHPPGPALLLWGAARIFGASAVGLSWFTVLFAALAIPALYCWVRTWAPVQTALLSGCLWATTPAWVIFSVTSIDALFVPVTLASLCCFEVGLRKGGAGWGILAGIGFAVMILLHFFLAAMGLYCLLSALLWGLREGGWRRVMRHAACSVGAFIGVLVLIWCWSGFSWPASLLEAWRLIGQDRAAEHLVAPRYGFWWWRALNPLAWFYYVGLPVSLLCISRLRGRNPGWAGMPLVLVLVLLALTLLYPGKGEGERSMLFLFPLLTSLAADRLWTLSKEANGETLLLCALAFMAFQCWLTEAYFYTYW